MSIRSIAAVAGLVLALALAAVSFPGTGAEASSVVEASVSKPVTMPVVPSAPTFVASPYADAPRDLSAPAPQPAPTVAPAPEPPAPARPPRRRRPPGPSTPSCSATSAPLRVEPKRSPSASRA